MHRVFWEGSDVVAAIIVSVSALVGLALVFFGAYKIKTKSFELGVSVFRVLTVTLEVESPPEGSEQPAAAKPHAPGRPRGTRIR